MLKFMASNHYRAGDALIVVPCFLDDNGFNQCATGSKILTEPELDHFGWNRIGLQA